MATHQHSADRLDGFQADFSFLLGASFADPGHAAAHRAERIFIEDKFNHLAARDEIRTSDTRVAGGAGIWRRGGDSEPIGELKAHKLLIPDAAPDAGAGRNAAVGYTAGTRKPRTIPMDAGGASNLLVLAMQPVAPSPYGS